MKHEIKWDSRERVSGKREQKKRKGKKGGHYSEKRLTAEGDGYKLMLDEVKFISEFCSCYSK